MSVLHSLLLLIWGCIWATCGAPVMLKVGFVLDKNQVAHTDQLFSSLNTLKQKYPSSQIDFKFVKKIGAGIIQTPSLKTNA